MMPMYEPEFIKKNVFLSAVNTKARADKLQRVPHLEVEGTDVSLVPMLIMSEEEGHATFCDVTYSFLFGTGINEKSILHYAEINMYFRMHLNVSSMFDAIGGEIYNSGKGPGHALDEIGDSMSGIYICTNQFFRFGAGEIFLPEVQRRMCGICKGSFTVIPSSVHEVMCISDDAMVDSGDMLEAVVETNRVQLPLNERLSEKRYRYDRKTGKFSME